jgi:hypothetical protein
MHEDKEGRKHREPVSAGEGSAGKGTQGPGHPSDEAAGDAETGEVPIGVPVSPEEYRRLKEEAAKPSPEKGSAERDREGDEGGKGQNGR